MSLLKPEAVPDHVWDALNENGREFVVRHEALHALYAYAQYAPHSSMRKFVTGCNERDCVDVAAKSEHDLMQAGVRAWEMLPRLKQPAHSPPCAPPWTSYEQRLALEGGWGVFDVSGGGVCIQRNDERQRFDSDEAAVAFVGRRASLGDPLAWQAFEYLAWEHSVNDAAEDL